MIIAKIKDNFTFDFNDGKLFSKKEVIGLIIPVVLDTVLSYLIGLMDSVMVSSAGESAVSAVSLVDAISVLFINIFIALAAGGAVIAGQYLGKKNIEKSKHSAQQIMNVLLLTSIIITFALLIWQNQLLNFLYGKAPDDVKIDCAIYYKIVMKSIPFIALYNGGAALYRIAGDGKTPMKISVVANIINVVGNALLIYVAKMGVAGVAIPTLVSRAFSMVVMTALLFKKDFILNLRSVGTYKYDSRLMKDILNIGIPSSIENGMFQFGKIVLLTLVSTLSTAAITANAIGNTVGSLHCVIGISIYSAEMTLVSRCAGAGDYKQARWYIRYILKITYIVQGVANIVFIIMIPLIMKIYNATPDTIKYAVPILLIHGISTIFLYPVSFMLNTGMRAAGDSKFAMWIASISMWVFRVGVAYILVLFTNIGVFGIWIAWTIDWIFRSSFFIPRYLGHKWENKAVKV